MSFLELARGEIEYFSMVGGAMKPLEEIRLTFYRAFMKLAHYYNWHHTRLIYPEGDTQIWCTWCGLRQTIKRRAYGVDRSD